MTSGTFRFERFRLDPQDRQLLRDGAPVELNTRYLDALTLLVREQGRLVSKTRFFEEVWRGVPVTDEALTQCIKTLRKQLGDDAARPRFIETVPKHGYRFIAPVSSAELQPQPQPQPQPESESEPGPRAGAGSAAPGAPAADGDRTYSWRQFLLLGAAGTVGGGVAGVFGGLLYGFFAASQSLQAGVGAASMLLVLLFVTVLVALVGAAGVSFGIAAAGFAARGPSPWSILGGAVGGLLVGAVVKLLGLDAFNLLIGRSPGDITGGPEGALLGGAVGVGAWLVSRGPAHRSLSRSIALAGLVGGVAGLTIPLLGGRLMGGSLDLVARQFPDSRLRLDQIGGLFGERGFGPISQTVTGAVEGALFGGCIVGAMILARRGLGSGR